MSATTSHGPQSVSLHPPRGSLGRATSKKDMPITHYLAHNARAKLFREASQFDHDLRLLVGHANLLDSLMVEVADTERERERWFSQAVRGVTHRQEERHVQWAEDIADDLEDQYDSDYDEDDDYDEDEDVVMTDTKNAPTLRPVPSKPGTSAAPMKLQSHISIVEEEEETEDDSEDYAQLELVRTHSHTSSLPELVDDSDSSDEGSMPPSPPQAVLHMTTGRKPRNQSRRSHSTMYTTIRPGELPTLPR